MIRQTINILAAPDRRAIVRIVEDSDMAYTAERFERDAAELAGLLALVLPFSTYQAVARIMQVGSKAIDEAMKARGI